MLKDNAITSVTLPISFASKPSPRSVAPATSADVAKFSPVACAKDKIPGAEFSISDAANPILDNSISKFATSVAVYVVLRPKSFAKFSNIFNSSPVAPETAPTFAIALSNATTVSNASLPISSPFSSPFIAIAAPPIAMPIPPRTPPKPFNPLS